MNVEEAIKAAAKWRSDEKLALSYTAEAAIALVTEVERLRAELAAAKADVERLREANQLLHAKVASSGAEIDRLQNALDRLVNRRP